MAKLIVIVEILVAESNAKHTLSQQLLQRMCDLIGIAMIISAAVSG